MPGHSCLELRASLSMTYLTPHSSPPPLSGMAGFLPLAPQPSYLPYTCACLFCTPSLPYAFPLPIPPACLQPPQLFASHIALLPAFVLSLCAFSFFLPGCICCLRPSLALGKGERGDGYMRQDGSGLWGDLNLQACPTLTYFLILHPLPMHSFPHLLLHLFLSSASLLFSVAVCVCVDIFCLPTYLLLPHTHLHASTGAFLPCTHTHLLHTCCLPFHAFLTTLLSSLLPSPCCLYNLPRTFLLPASSTMPFICIYAWHMPSASFYHNTFLA